MENAKDRVKERSIIYINCWNGYKIEKIEEALLLF